jgi:iron(III) transport system substrate-binding protein
MHRRFAASVTLLLVLIVTLVGCGAAGAPATSAPGSAGGASTPTRTAALTTTPATSAAGAAGATPATRTTTPAAAPAGQTEGQVVIYSARREALMKPLVDAFTAQTGIKVTLKSGSPGELALLIEQERGRSGGDVHFSTDAATAESLRQKGLLEPYVSPNAAGVPAEFKAADGAWTGVIGRSRNIIYNSDLVRPEDAPRSVFALTDPQYRGKVAIASIREGGVRLWLASLLQERGEEFTVKYINDLLANGMQVLPNHTEVTNAVVRGEVALGLANHYYYALEVKKNPGAPLGLIYPDQGPNDAGTLVMPLTVGIIKGAKNPGAARAFVDFALSGEGQLPLTTQESEFPLAEGVPLGEAAAPGVKPIGEIKRPRTDFAKLAEAEKRAVELFTPLLGGN